MYANNILMYYIGCAYPVIISLFVVLVCTVIIIRTTDDRRKVSDRCPLVTVRADFRGMRRQHRGPRALGPVARQPPSHHATLPPKQLEHHIDVGTRPVPSQGDEESSLVHRHERQHQKETRTL